MNNYVRDNKVRDNKVRDNKVRVIIKSAKSVNKKVRQKYWPISVRIFGISVVLDRSIIVSK